MIRIGLAGPQDGDAVAGLYAEAGYGAGVQPDDTVIVATIEAMLVGVVRLCPEEGVVVLRGMQVRAEYQRQGIGARMLAACLPHLIGMEAFCLPYSHLERFYAAAGFVRAQDASLPAFLAQRLGAYRARGQDVIAMRGQAVDVGWTGPREAASPSARSNTR